VDFVKNPEKAKAKNTHATIFEVMLTPDDSKSYRVPSLTALKEEAWGNHDLYHPYRHYQIADQKHFISSNYIGVLAAGTETTANVLTVGVYEACRNVEIQEKLYSALKAEFKTMDEPITDVRCQQIPYLVSWNTLFILKQNFYSILPRKTLNLHRKRFASLKNVYELLPVW